MQGLDTELGDDRAAVDGDDPARRAEAAQGVFDDLRAFAQDFSLEALLATAAEHVSVIGQVPWR